MRTNHNELGNCWLDQVAYNCPDCGVSYLCDVCHMHDMPRGECDKCPACDECDEERGET